MPWFLHTAAVNVTQRLQLSFYRSAAKPPFSFANLSISRFGASSAWAAMINVSDKSPSQNISAATEERLNEL